MTASTSHSVPSLASMGARKHGLAPRLPHRRNLDLLHGLAGGVEWGVPLAGVGYEARWINGKVATVDGAGEHRYRVARPRLAWTEATLAKAARLSALRLRTLPESDDRAQTSAAGLDIRQGLEPAVASAAKRDDPLSSVNAIGGSLDTGGIGVGS